MSTCLSAHLTFYELLMDIQQIWYEHNASEATPPLYYNFLSSTVLIQWPCKRVEYEGQ
jgi:hypothetical protein